MEVPGKHLGAKDIQRVARGWHTKVGARDTAMERHGTRVGITRDGPSRDGTARARSQRAKASRTRERAKAKEMEKGTAARSRPEVGHLNETQVKDAMVALSLKMKKKTISGLRMASRRC